MPASGEAITPAAQMTVWASIRSRRSIVSLRGHSGRVEIDDHLVQPRRHAEALQRSLRLLRERRRECAQHPITGLDQQDPCRARVKCAEVASQVAGDLGDLARHLHAGRAGADDHERQQRCAPGGVVLELSGLERRQDLAPDRQRPLERLQLGGRLTPFVVSEVVVLGAAGDDQGVVGDGLRLRLVDHRFDVDKPVLEVDVGDFGEQHADVAPAAEDPSQRIRDLPR